MAETAHAAQADSRAARRDPEQAPLDAADFPGCRAIRIAPEEIEDYDGRVEYWEARSATAMQVCEPTSTWHERPSQRLARLAERIAAVRGLPIETLGASDLVRFDSGGKPRVLMQADQIVYLQPPFEALHRVGAAMGAARGTGPDDDPWLRHYRDESRYEAVLAALAERGIETTPALPARMSQLGDVPVTRMMRAALRCGSEEEFLELCAAGTSPSG